MDRLDGGGRQSGQYEKRLREEDHGWWGVAEDSSLQAATQPDPPSGRLATVREGKTSRTRRRLG